jgi:drug/metabolite transporter (DMT)-like permease
MLRMLLSLPFYLVILYTLSQKDTSKPLPIKTFYWAVIMGLVGYYMSSLFDFIGLQYVSAGIERIILFIYPTLAVLINFIIFKQPVFKRQWWAIIITYIGIGIAYWGEMKQFNNTPLFLYGSLMVLLCGITYAAYLVGTGKLIPKMGANKYTSVAMLSATIGIFAHYLITQDLHLVTQYLNFNSPIFYYIIALALISTVIPSFLLNTGMQKIGSNDLAIVTSIGPVATLFQAYLVLHEPFSLLQGFGTLLVIAGVLMVKK